MQCKKLVSQHGIVVAFVVLFGMLLFMLFEPHELVNLYYIKNSSFNAKNLKKAKNKLCSFNDTKSLRIHHLNLLFDFS